jgi:hypothetical protein
LAASDTFVAWATEAGDLFTQRADGSRREQLDSFAELVEAMDLRQGDLLYAQGTRVTRYDTTSRDVSQVGTGFAEPVAIAFAGDDVLVLDGGRDPRSGALVRLRPDRSRQLVVAGLSRPRALAVAASGDAYLTADGFSAVETKGGVLLRVDANLGVSVVDRDRPFAGGLAVLRGDSGEDLVFATTSQTGGATEVVRYETRGVGRRVIGTVANELALDISASRGYVFWSTTNGADSTLHAVDARGGTPGALLTTSGQLAAIRAADKYVYVAETWRGEQAVRSSVRRLCLP